MKRTSLFLLLFVSMSSLCASEAEFAARQVDVNAQVDGLRTRVQTIRDQEENMDDLTNKTDGLRDGADRFRQMGKKPSRSWHERLFGSKSSGSQATPRTERGGGDGNVGFGVGGPDAETARDAEKVANTSAGRGLEANIGEDGKVSFDNPDGSKRKWNWFRSTSDYQEMQALKIKDRELSTSFNKEDRSLSSEEMIDHLAEKEPIRKALNERASRLENNKKWWLFGGRTEKSEEARVLKENTETFHESYRNLLEEKVRSERLAKADRSSLTSNSINGEIDRRMESAHQKLYGRGRDAQESRAVDNRLSQPEQTQRAQRSNEPLTNRYSSEDTRQRLNAQREAIRQGKLNRAQESSARLKNNSENFLDAARQSTGRVDDNRGPRRSERPEQRAQGAIDAQSRLDDTSLGKGMRNRTDNFGRLGDKGDAMRDNAGVFGDVASRLRKQQESKKWWQW